MGRLFTVAMLLGSFAGASATLGAGCGSGTLTPAGAGAAADPAAADEPLAPDPALDRLQALRAPVKQLLGDVRETTTHPDPPAGATLDALWARLGDLHKQVNAARIPRHDVAWLLEGQYDEWLVEVQSILERHAEPDAPQPPPESMAGGGGGH